MKKIVYYTHPYFLDCDLPLIKELREQGMEVYVFINIAPNVLKSTLVNIDHQKKINHIFNSDVYKEFQLFEQFIELEKLFFVNRTSKVYGLSNFKLRLDFLKKIKEIRPDVVHVTDFLDTFDTFLYTFRKKLVQVVHDPFPHIGENSFRRELFRKIGLKLISKFVLLNVTQKALFMKRYKIRDSEILVNKLGPYDCIKLFNKPTCITDRVGYILFFGRISKYKGVDVLLNAMKSIGKNYPDAHLIVVGSGEFHFDIEMYRNLPYITFINRFVSMHELHLLIERSRFTVCPYIEATQSGVVMTSFSLNKPVVVTNVGGLPEMVQDGVNGLVIEPNNILELEQALVNLLINNSLYEQMKENIAIQMNVGAISWKEIAGKYIKFYNVNNHLE